MAQQFGMSLPPPPYLPPPPPGYVPPPPPPPTHRDRYNQDTGAFAGKVILGVGVAGGAILVGWGVLSFLQGIAPGGAAISACQSDFQTAMGDYNAAFQQYVKDNAGAALSTEQEATLSGYLSTAQQAVQCAMNIGNASVEDWSTAATEAVLIIAAAAGTTILVKQWIAARGKISTASQAAQGLRNGATGKAVNDGDISQSDGAGLQSQTSRQAADDAATEANNGATAAESGAAQAQADDNVDLEDNYNAYLDVYNAEETIVADDATYWADLLG